MDRQHDAAVDGGGKEADLAGRRAAQLAALVSAGRGRHVRRSTWLPQARARVGRVVAQLKAIREGGNRLVLGGIITAGAALSLVIGMVIGGAFAGVDVALPPASRTQQTPIIRYASPTPSTRSAGSTHAPRSAPHSTTTVPSTTVPTTTSTPDKGAAATTGTTAPGAGSSGSGSGTSTGSGSGSGTSTGTGTGTGSGSGTSTGTGSGSGSGTSTGSGSGSGTSTGTGSGSGSGSTGGSGGGTSPPPHNPLSGLGQALFG